MNNKELTSINKLFLNPPPVEGCAKREVVQTLLLKKTLFDICVFTTPPREGNLFISILAFYLIYWHKKSGYKIRFFIKSKV